MLVLVADTTIPSGSGDLQHIILDSLGVQLQWTVGETLSVSHRKVCCSHKASAVITQSLSNVTHWILSLECRVQTSCLFFLVLLCFVFHPGHCPLTRLTLNCIKAFKMHDCPMFWKVVNQSKEKIQIVWNIVGRHNQLVASWGYKGSEGLTWRVIKTSLNWSFSTGKKQYL